MVSDETEACRLNISMPTKTGTKDIERTGLMGQKPKSGEHECTICLPATVNTLH